MKFYFKGIRLIHVRISRDFTASEWSSTLENTLGLYFDKGAYCLRPVIPIRLDCTYIKPSRRLGRILIVLMRALLSLDSCLVVLEQCILPLTYQRVSQGERRQ